MAHFFDQEYDAYVAAAMVAVNLLSYERYLSDVNKTYTKYSAQYLVDNACSKKEGETDRDSSKVTAKDCLEFGLKEEIPKDEDWSHLASLSKPPSSYNPPLVSMNGKVYETEDLDEAIRFLVQRPIGARLHVFSPELDGENVKWCCYFRIFKIFRRI